MDERSEIRKPVQKRAIEKRNRILTDGFQLMCEKGYHNVDCIEIAKVAGVSTGTVYQYFKDKRDIFLQGLRASTKETLFPILKYKNITLKKSEMKKAVQAIIDETIKKHYSTKDSHEEIMAMRHSDSEVAKIFNEFELEATNALVDILSTNNVHVNDLYERAHIIITWVDHLCHEIVYHKHKNINYDHMKSIVTDAILKLLI